MNMEELLAIAKSAVENGYGDVDINEYLREYEEWYNDKVEELEERQSYYDAYMESLGSPYDNM